MIVNSKTGNTFQLERDIIQGDPIYPYIFIMCAEYLERFIHFMSNHEIRHKY